MTAPCVTPPGRATTVFRESGCLGMQPKVGGKLHLKLNMGTRPIANKYREGKVGSFEVGLEKILMVSQKSHGIHTY